MAFDCVVQGGSLIDGTGAPARVADLGIRDGRVVAIGAIGPASGRTVDASGRIVAPGFIDIHTHYDAQAFWDPLLTPSSLHGVTTVVGGNCGFSIAPLDAQSAPYLMRMLARVEGMPLESLQQGLDWSWSSFAEYLARLDGSLAVNAGFLVGHSTLRRVVMGAAAVGSAATPEQRQAMRRLLDESIAGGALGFSSSSSPTHSDGDGQPVPSRHATRDEILELSAGLAEHPGSVLEYIPTFGRFDEQHYALMTEMSLAANRPLNWNVLGVGTLPPDVIESQLDASNHALERGAIVLALTPAQVVVARVNLASGVGFDSLPDWADTLALPLSERSKALADPGRRRRLAQGAARSHEMAALADWDRMQVEHTFLPENRGLRGRTLSEIGDALGKTAFDAMLDLAVEEDLRTSFRPHLGGDDDASWALRARAWRDPRTVIGASDAGAHVDMLDTFTFSTSLLGEGVRERGLLTWEEAVRELTEVPARLYGLRDRGSVVEGSHADLVVFDPARVGPGPVELRMDLPGAAGRLYAEARGIDNVFVNGVEIVSKGAPTGARPGRVLRSGRDTETVSVPGGRDPAR